MRRLKKMKLLSISVLLLAGMSSCVDIPDKEFSLNLRKAYVEQISRDEFIPYFYVQPVFYADYVIKSGTATSGDITYNLSNIGIGCQTSTYYGDSKLPEGTYMITATSTAGETANISMAFNLKETQVMGDLIVDSLIYSKSEGIKVSCQPVKNADAYCLLLTPVVKDQDGNEIVVKPSTVFGYWDSDRKKTSGTFRGNEFTEKGMTYKVAVAALSGESMPNLVVLKSTSKNITIEWEGNR